MHFKDYKSVLSSKDGMNIYRGCTHGCIYCDSRSNCYKMLHKFEDVQVKKDAPKILDAQLRRKRTSCMVSTGSMCDPYLHEEEKLQYMRRCLEVILAHGCGVSILTKSSLILRDADLLAAINTKAKCVVQMTLTTFDDELCRIVEPNVSVTSQRFAALKKFKELGIPTVVWLCPLLPFINDDENNLRSILELCAQADVYGIMNFGFGVTLRSGSREYFYAALDRHFPSLKEKYISAYGNAYVLDSPNCRRLADIFFSFCAEKGIVADRAELFEFLQTLPDRQLSFL